MPNVAVTLSVRVWIEMPQGNLAAFALAVTLSVRVWIEICLNCCCVTLGFSHPQCEGVD